MTGLAFADGVDATPNVALLDDHDKKVLQGIVMRRIENIHTGNARPSRLAIAQERAWHEDRQHWQGLRPLTAALAEPLEIMALEDDRLATATTDGRKLMFNPAWSAELSPEQRGQIQEHLIWHAAAGDYRPYHDKNIHRWHLACDHSINVQLIQLGADIVLGTVLFPLAASWRRNEVYTWLAGHPRPEIEQSPDQFIWQTKLSLPADELSGLDNHWQEHIQATVQRFLHTPWLPDNVAAWLLGRR